MSFSFPEALHVVYNVHGKKFVTKVSDLNSEGVAQIPYLVYDTKGKLWVTYKGKWVNTNITALQQYAPGFHWIHYIHALHGKVFPPYNLKLVYKKLWFLAVGLAFEL